MYVCIYVYIYRYIYVYFWIAFCVCVCVDVLSYYVYSPLLECKLCKGSVSPWHTLILFITLCFPVTLIGSSVCVWLSWVREQGSHGYARDLMYLHAPDAISRAVRMICLWGEWPMRYFHPLSFLQCEVSGVQCILNIAENFFDISSLKILDYTQV